MAKSHSLFRPTRAVLFLVLMACSREPDAHLPGEERVLAKVGKTQLDGYDVELALSKTFSEGTTSQADERVRKTMLESLVQTRAIALAMESELKPDELRALDRELAYARDEKLVQMYLRRHAERTPVGQAEVEAYYRDHPERFGGDKVALYEVIVSDGALAAAERDRLLNALANAAKHPDFRGWSEELRAQKLNVRFADGRADSPQLRPELKKRLQQMTEASPPEVVVLPDSVVVLRMKGMDASRVVPLAQASKQIREELATGRLKEALHGAAEAALKKVSVEYLEH